MATPEAQPSPPARKPPIEGRDHLNLADFPISVLQRQQPQDGAGNKVDTVVYHSTRYDRRAGYRVPQTVTLTTNSKLGLPTPADENVVLALLYLAKKVNNFTEAIVPFTPRQLFQVMHWSPNSRSYVRLRDVLRRLKSLTITYQNSWWDRNDRQYEQEFATGIIAGYKIARQTAGQPSPESVPGSWLRWDPQFHESVMAGNLKRLDLEQLFALKLPTSQRMYRFLDKHFYRDVHFELDLRDFACGHVGLSASYDIGQLKHKLQPAIAELERIGFILPAAVGERYEKLRPGVWRIKFQQKISACLIPSAVSQPLAINPLERELMTRGIGVVKAAELVSGYSAAVIEHQVAVYDWLRRHQSGRLSRNPAGYLVKAITDNYAAPPEFERQRGRVQRQEAERRELHRQWRTETEDAEREAAARAAFQSMWQPVWEKLPANEQQRVRDEMLVRSPWFRQTPSLLHSACLKELARRAGGGAETAHSSAV